MKQSSSVEPSIMLLPLILMGKITHEEAGLFTHSMINQKIPRDTRELQAQIEMVIGRKL